MCGWPDLQVLARHVHTGVGGRITSGPTEGSHWEAKRLCVHAAPSLLQQANPFDHSVAPPPLGQACVPSKRAAWGLPASSPLFHAHGLVLVLLPQHACVLPPVNFEPSTNPLPSLLAFPNRAGTCT